LGVLVSGSNCRQSVQLLRVGAVIFMDFLECPDCRERYVVRDAGRWDDPICRDCGTELRLVAEGLPGDGEQIEDALHANFVHPDEPYP
jgi:hypothetical protein